MDNRPGAVKNAGVISAQNEEEVIAPSLRDMLEEALEDVGYGAEVDSLRNSRQRAEATSAWTKNGTTGIKTSDLKRQDIVVLDHEQLEMDRTHLGRMLGEAEVTRIIILAVAADDITRPLHEMELLALVRAALDRSQPVSEEQDTFFCNGELSIDYLAREVKLAGEVVKLTPKEYGILYHLASNPGRPLTHSDLLCRVWGPEYVDATEYLKVHIQHLRRKLGDNPENPCIIATERGVGYKFIAESASPADSECTSPKDVKGPRTCQKICPYLAEFSH